MSAPPTSARQTTTVWYNRPDQAPPDTTPADTPFGTREWATAWTRATTEQILAHRHLHLDDATYAQTVSFHLTPGGGSPCWNLLETAAAMATVWPGTVLWAGSPHAEYGGASTASPAIAAATAAKALTLAAQLGACAVVYSGLNAEQAGLVHRAVPKRRQSLNLTTAVAHTRPLGASLQEWWAATPGRHRRDLRRQWRRGTDAGLAPAALTSTDLLAALPQFARLAQATTSRHRTPLYNADLFRLLATVPGAVLLTARDSAGNLAGGVYGWLHGDCLYLWAAGLDYSHPTARHIYTWLITEAARWAIGHGATRIDLGRGNYRAKKILGCTPHPLRTVVHLTTPDDTTSTALRELSTRLGRQAATYLPPGTTW
ncbi:GNAT family N-acetyltransferase [Streptomyces sp. YIM 98790]|uniref:GNAT family N-acetyltransferase n=1 Tax=Streptomyces sp. YIM 98790 TaxID=2689077 RepID=UPI00140A12DE|nr:GNAT family N-acetyltransferase [Streptomyces sp. YIM 98790]